MIEAFVELVRQNQRDQMQVVEVGCWGGETSVGWLPIVTENHGFGFLVDNFHGNPTAVGPESHTNHRRDDIYAQLWKRTEGFRASIVEGDSEAMANRFEDGSLDIVFIDADHRYSKVSKDILAWMPKVKRGGILCGHDCEGVDYDERFIETDCAGAHHGVIKAVKELVPNVQLIGGTVWMTKIP